MGTKLKKKNEGSNTLMDIASRLRNTPDILPHLDEHRNDGQGIEQSESQNTETVAVETPHLNSDCSSIEELISMLKDKNYNFADPIKIDADVKEIFRLMKVNAKVPISSLISYILEEWIREHEKDIRLLLTHKKNRLL